MDKGKAIFFEEINVGNFPLAMKYINRVHTVYFFKTHNKIKEQRVLKEYIEAGKLIDISKMIFRYSTVYALAAFYAHEKVDRIFEEYFSRNSSIKTMSRLLRFPEIENMYRRNLLLKLEKLYVIELKINEILNSCEYGEVHLYPTGNFKFHSGKFSLLNKKVKVLRNSSFFRLRLSQFGNRMYEVLKLCYLMVMIVKRIRVIPGNQKPKEYRVAIMDDYPHNILRMNYFGNNIFIDEAELPKEDMLFLVPRLKDKVALEAAKKYNCVSLDDSKLVVRPRLLWQKFIKRFSPAWLKSLILPLWEDQLILETNFMILSDYIKWNIITDSYKINNYIQRLLPDNMSRIRILSENNIKTWFVYPDNTSHDYHLDWDAERKNQTLHSFMYYDNTVIYGDIIERFLKKHRNFITKYVKNGVLFSQTIRELQEGKLKSPIFSLVKEKKLPRKIIGVFDTTFTDLGPVKAKDGTRFGNDMLRLLDELPDIGIIFKAAKESESTPHLTPVYEQLKRHPRCLLFYRYSKEGISAPEVIAASSLVVSAAYTSCAAEALGARVKAFYYDIGGHDIGERYYLNRFPNFVAHSYGELKRLVHYWMDECTGEDFSGFLNTYVKNEIDPYLDGKAFSRLRKLLV